MLSCTPSRLLVPLAVIIWISSGIAHGGDTLQVPEDFPSIQAAIDATADGDSVLVGPGTYFESIDFRGKNIVVSSAHGPGVTVIDGRSSPLGAVSFVSGEDDSTLSGFTIRRGQPGILCVNSSPTVDNCWVVHNDFSGNGAGVRLENSSAVIRSTTIASNDGGDGGAVWASGPGQVTITNCEISQNTASNGGGIVFRQTNFCVLETTVSGNSATFSGGGIMVLQAVGSVVDCRIVNNTAPGYGGGLLLVGETRVVDSEIAHNISGETGAGVVIHDNTRLERCTVWGNQATSYAGGIYSSGGSTTIVNCTVTHNEAGGGGTALTTHEFFGVPTNVVVTNCIFWENGPAHYSVEIDPTTNVAIRYSNVQGGIGDEGIISQDPRFIQEDAGDFHLHADSPCLDAGDPDGRRDSDGSIADLGAFPFLRHDFIRGDVDADGVVRVADALFLLNWGFLGGPIPLCLDAADVDDSGTLSSLLDGFALLRWLFGAGPLPPVPGPMTCGPDPGGHDPLSCGQPPPGC